MGCEKFCSDEELREFMESDGNRLIWSFVNRYCKGLELEDCWQECFIAVAKALGSYNPESPAKKTTYVSQAIYNQIKMMIRANNTNKRAINREASSVEGNPFLADPAYDLEDMVITKISLEQRSNSLLKAIEVANLTNEEKVVIRMTLKNKSQKEVGNAIGISQSQVSRLRGTALAKIKVVLEDYGWDGVSSFFP